MKSIYASKLYRSSKRKDSIQAALLDTANLGLVNQLSEYLDEEYQTPEYLGEPESEKPAADEGSEDDDLMADLDAGLGDDFDAKNNLVSVPSGGHSSGPSGPPPTKKDIEDIDIGDAPSSEPSGRAPEGPDAEPSAEPAADAEAATSISNKTKITSCTDTEITVMKGSLNSREDTAGVARIQNKDEKGHELWIYYNDDVNLNNIMYPVIEYLNASGQTYLEFNRLARSENAMVFQIREHEEIKSIEEINKDEE